MALIKLGIRHFRNLHSVDLEPAADLNLITGMNASGKTSLLEAIYYLGRASSFRTHRFDKIVENGEKELTVYAQQLLENGQKVPFGLKKTSKTVQIRINEQKITKVADLVYNLPLQVIHPNSHQLLDDGPKYRRQFLDWGVFHVEQSFYPVWQRYQIALKQRNTALRTSSSKKLIQIWDYELLEAGAILNAKRLAYLEELQALLTDFIRPVLGSMDIKLTYQSGWSRELSFEQALHQALDTDRERGFTGVGPQRADMNVQVDGVLAADRISRGQQKVLVTSLLLAQAGLYTQKTSKKCILLIDDVAAELDSDNKKRLLKVLMGMDVQLFITSLEAETFLPIQGSNKQTKVFHVEHGTVSEVV